MTRITTRERAQGALWGLFLADALAMPVHWYYDRVALARDYGRVTDYLARSRSRAPGAHSPGRADDKGSRMIALAEKVVHGHSARHLRTLAIGGQSGDRLSGDTMKAPSHR